MLKIIDNVLNDSLLITIKKRIEAPESMPWYFIENSATHGSSNILNYSFYHLVLDKENYNNEILSPSIFDMTNTIALISKRFI